MANLSYRRGVGRYKQTVELNLRTRAGQGIDLSTYQRNLQTSAIDPEQWVDEYGDYLYRYAMSRLRDPSAAEEVVQDTFLAGIRKQDQFAGTGSQRGWLMGILKRKIIDFVRARSRREQRFGEDELDPTALLFDENGRWKAGVLPQIAPDTQVESRELWGVVRECLKHLPAGQADVFVLSVMEEMESDEICKELEITSSNLWVRLHRARLGLAKCVGAKWFDGENSQLGTRSKHLSASDSALGREGSSHE